MPGIESPTTQISSRRWIAEAIVLAALVLYLYAGILVRLVQHWWIDPNFSHGFFVPAFALFVLWQRRAKLATVPRRPDLGWGTLIIACSLCILVVGVLGAELFLSRVSFVLLIGGLVVQFCGWGMLGAVLFPWAVLFLMIPIPTIVFNQIAFPLQLLASRLATDALSWCGVPVLREGNVIQLPALALEVAEACSGIRSLVSLATLAVIYGYFAETRISRRIWLIILAIPIAVLVNGLRIMGTGLVAQYWDPARAQGFFHELSGWIIFMLSLGLMLLVHRAMSLFDRRPPRPS